MSDEPIYTPSEEVDELESFDSFSPEIKRGIDELGWVDPMPVQRRATPVMRRGRDIIVQAVTGSGKTGAFGLPILEIIDAELAAAQVLIMAPTRELAQQICSEVTLMGKYCDVEAVPVYGGTAYGPQLDAFERGAQVVVGTPGRLLDHLKSGRLKLNELRALIFDEADELLSLGFWPDMKEINSYVPKQRLCGLFSATMPQRVMSLARVFLDEPEFVSLTEGGVRAPEEIEHLHYIVQANQKEKALLRILKYEDPDSAIIFCNTRDDTRFVTAFLQRNKLDADMIQGEMTQAARESVMKRIKAGDLRLLVATDVAARGIDISDLSHVISYTSPDSPESYVHRTGRTGRAGKSGTAISLVSGLDIGNFRSIMKVNRMTIPERALPSEEDLAERLAQRIQVEVEHSLRDLSDREKRMRMDEHLPVVKHLSATDEGQRDLAAIISAYLEKKHVSAPKEEEVAAQPKQEREPRQARGGQENRARSDSSDGAPRADSDDGEAPRRRRRRRRRPGGPGGSGSGERS
ncbi:MAG: DEAD/DEAH box helicase [bacterium]|nr:DEAD/DEAH box helicase [bacterium]